MLIKFFSNGTGGGAAPVNYLIARTVLAYDENRDLIRDDFGHPKTVIRDPLPEVLRGDPKSIIDLIDSCRNKRAYKAGVVSFSTEDAPSEDQQHEVIDQFEQIAFAGLDADQYACLWVRHTHEDRVELHFCTPSIELQTGLSLNIAPPGHEHAFNSVRDLLNKTHSWDDPMDSSRALETKRVAEAPDRAAGREALHGWIRDQIYEGLITDRAALTGALKEAGFEVPRAGKNYITVKDPITNERWRLKGEFFHEDWRAETTLERKAERGPGTDAPRERRLDGSSIAELQRRFEDHCRKRAGYNQDRYGNVSVERAEAPLDAEQPEQEAGPSPRDVDDGSEPVRDDQLGPVDLGDWDDHAAQGELFGREASGAGGGDLSGAHHGSGQHSAMSSGKPDGRLPQDRRVVRDGWSDAVGARIAELRRAVDGGLESLCAGIESLRGAMGAGHKGGTGWLEALRDRAGEVAGFVGRCIERLDGRRSDLRGAIAEAQGQLGERPEGTETDRHALNRKTDAEEPHGLRH
ncbi:relaxase/mobilization nuclease domain-containing protein [Loktanella sp. S4079]|uniref:relaxase/mobilization nuclease domain-containing protein n=1 Tax=Loktanella sp. S4079 TaxID=579483 RepID=UPI0005FA3634|nr:relaxase/mobilization nuclease domain-containing protein [Loktanella sp. S4079]KJZ20861.1 mobilization relaxase [Loktanella sp. S4079]